MDASNRIWWIAETEGVRGPFTREEILDRVKRGSLSENALIRRGESGDWSTAGEVVPAAFSESSLSTTTDPGQSSEALEPGSSSNFASRLTTRKLLLMVSGLFVGLLVIVLLAQGSGSGGDSEFDRLLNEYQSNWDSAPSDYNIQTCMAWQIYGPQGFRAASAIAVSEVEWEALKTLLSKECQ